jgi:hypothetical protein
LGGIVALELFRRHSTVPQTLVLAGAYAGWAGSLPADAVARFAVARFAVARFAVARFAVAVRATNPAGFRAMTWSSAEADLRDILATVDVPTLLLYGDRDARAPLDVVLHVGLIHGPAISGGVPKWAGGVGQQWRESLHPPVDRDVVDLDAALGQQFLHVAVGQAVAEVPADRDRDHPRWDPEPGKRRPVDVGPAARRRRIRSASSAKRDRHRPGAAERNRPGTGR